jgi:hypothetical protein
LLAPLAYYPTFLATAADPSPAAFARLWLSLPDWPAGPAWFLWLLLAFDCMAGLLFVMAPRWGAVLSRMTPGAHRRPFGFFAGLVIISAMAYVPVVIAAGPWAWHSAGPFTTPTSRLLLYAIYFLAGVSAGAHGLERGLLNPGGVLGNHWVLWILAAIAAFGLFVAVAVVAPQTPGVSRPWDMVGALVYVLSCASSGMAFLALFTKLVKTRRPVFDSLRDNAYGMYLIHYVFVTWLQYALLGTQAPVVVKGLSVFCGGLVLSWVTSLALRRVPAVARLI